MTFRSNNVLISIIMPVFNREHSVEETLIELLNNKHRPIELVLVNDGSTDKTLVVLNIFKNTYGNKDFNVKVISQENNGAPSARNNGLRNSTGEYIQFLDSDDFISNDKFVRQLDLMIRNDAEFGLCDFEMVYKDENNKRVYHSNEKGLKKVIFGGSFCCGAPLLKASLAKSIEWTERMKRNQDVDYFQKAALLSNKIAYLPESHYYYIRYNGINISSGYNKTMYPYNERIKSLLGIALNNKSLNISLYKKLLFSFSALYLFLKNIKQYSRIIINWFVRFFI